MQKRSENEWASALEDKYREGNGNDSEHSLCLEISEKTYDICELLAFKLGKMPGFTWGAAEQMSFAAGGGVRRKNKSAGV